MRNRRQESKNQEVGCCLPIADPWLAMQMLLGRGESKMAASHRSKDIISSLLENVLGSWDSSHCSSGSSHHLCVILNQQEETDPCISLVIVYYTINRHYDAAVASRHVSIRSYIIRDRLMATMSRSVSNQLLFRAFVPPIGEEVDIDDPSISVHLPRYTSAIIRAGRGPLKNKKQQDTYALRP
ncbi:unnamed protein product [Nezara viridula]|uniref:Uncharacterized protein n=1 Tax=Nezara viridula TaxID=85310 RepID=A0A9P0HFL4_NEZVI|nr:unnamed protein product [Nezara viridula]